MEVFTPYSGLDILNIRYTAFRAKSIRRNEENHLVIHKAKIYIQEETNYSHNHESHKYTSLSN